ncbi:GGDEF domain-containing protein [Marinomonas rhizomae]|nr:GGDEF domain-containing protein [Marinomonas rhizomae]
MPNKIETQLSHKLILRIIELSILTLIIDLTLRPFFVTLPIYFTWIGLVDLVMVTGLYVVIRCNAFPALEIYISLFIAIIIILPSLVLSGGVNSQVAYLLPLYPVMAALIGGYRESLIITILLVIGVILATIFSEHFIDLTEEAYSSTKSIDRGFWLAASIIFSGVFGRFFLKRYSELTEQLKNENIQDPLTGLLNRRGLNLYFSQELDNAEVSNLALSLILIDIDYFKKVNDMYGHDIGDRCLIEIANTLSQAIRKTDIIARFGGEEFIIILPNTQEIEAEVIAEKLRVLISEQKFSEFKLSLSITQGLTQRHSDNDNALKMIKRADKALYKGKEQGRNCIQRSE